jgi:hypothetical protein
MMTENPQQSPAEGDATAQALKHFAAFPLEEFSMQSKPDDKVITGFNDWILLVGHIRNARAALASQVQPKEIGREEARRYCAPGFQAWLDEPIADGGLTVFDTLASVHDAYSGFQAANHYARPTASNLPPLPATTYNLYYQWQDDEDHFGGSEVIDADGYTADQMRAYAMATAAAHLAQVQQAVAVPTGPRTEFVLNELRSALSAMTTFFGMDEDENSKAVFDKARQAYNYAEIVMRPLEPWERQSLEDFRACVGRWHEKACAKGYDGVEAMCDLALSAPQAAHYRGVALMVVENYEEGLGDEQSVVGAARAALRGSDSKPPVQGRGS